MSMHIKFIMYMMYHVHDVWCIWWTWCIGCTWCKECTWFIWHTWCIRCKLYTSCTSIQLPPELELDQDWDYYLFLVSSLLSKPLSPLRLPFPQSSSSWHYNLRSSSSNKNIWKGCWSELSGTEGMFCVTICDFNASGSNSLLLPLYSTVGEMLLAFQSKLGRIWRICVLRSGV